MAVAVVLVVTTSGKKEVVAFAEAAEAGMDDEVVEVDKGAEE